MVSPHPPTREKNVSFLVVLYPAYPKEPARRPCSLETNQTGTGPRFCRGREQGHPAALAGAGGRILLVLDLLLEQLGDIAGDALLLVVKARVALDLVQRGQGV